MASLVSSHVNTGVEIQTHYSSIMPEQADTELTGLFTRDLPDYVEEHIALSIPAVKAVLRKQRNENPDHEYVVLSHLPPSVVDCLVDQPNVLGKGTRLFYDERWRKAILSLPSRPHEQTISRIGQVVDTWCDTMGLLQSLDSIGASTTRDGPYRKEPDGSWVPETLPPGRTLKWPSMVLEVGYSESLRRLHVDANWWLCRSLGEVKTVVLISINRVEREITVETWIPDIDGIPLRGIRTCPTKRHQNLTIRGDHHNVVVNGAPLVIKFSDVFLRPPQNPQEVDLNISAQTLTAIALKVWKWQNFT